MKKKENLAGLFLIISVLTLAIFTAFVRDIGFFFNQSIPFHNGAYDTVDAIVQYASLVSIIAVFIQVYIMNNINRMDMSYKLYEENVEIRQLHHSAEGQLKELIDNLAEIEGNTDRNVFDHFYTKDEFKDIRRLAYHFEYLGYLVKNDKVHFGLIFDPITYPNWLFESSGKLIETARMAVPDFWEGLQFLYYQYELERKRCNYAKEKKANSRNKDKVKTKLEEARKNLEEAQKNFDICKKDPYNVKLLKGHNIILFNEKESKKVLPDEAKTIFSNAMGVLKQVEANTKNIENKLDESWEDMKSLFSAAQEAVAVKENGLDVKSDLLIKNFQYAVLFYRTQIELFKNDHYELPGKEQSIRYYEKLILKTETILKNLSV